MLFSAEIRGFKYTAMGKCEQELLTTALPVRKKIGFGIADMGGNLFFTAMGFWALTYLTDTVHLSPILAGTAIMIAKIWDAVTDPMVGYLSDRTVSRWDRRRPYLLFGAVPFGFSFWFFFTNPQIENQVLLFLWALAALCMVNTAVTIVNIPYSALTPELTNNYNEQTSINAYRFICAGIGTTLGALIVMPIVQTFSTKSAGFSAAGAVIGVFIIVSTLITFFSVKEPPAVPSAAIYSDKKTFLSAYKNVFSNTAYLMLLAAFVSHITALNFLQSMIVYYLKYIYAAEAFSSSITGLLLVSALLCIPLAAKIATRYGKKCTYQLGLALIGCCTLMCFFIGHRIGLYGLAVLFACAGIGVGFAFAIPWAMLPDAITAYTVKTGMQNEGCYYGVWTFMSKLGQAISIGVSGMVLSIFGYTAECTQQPQTIFAIKLLSGPLPAIICGIGCIFIYYYQEPTANR